MTNHLNKDVHPHVSKAALVMAVVIGIGAIGLTVSSSNQQQDPRSRASENQSASSSITDVIVSDPASTHDLLMLGRTRLPSWGNMTGVLAMEQFTNRTVAWFRDSTTGATSAVTLPKDSNQGWTQVATIMTSPEDLWTVGATGAIVVRHYKLSGSPLPTSATLVSSKSFGNSDSRAGDMTVLKSGAIMVAWHQQGENELPHGQFVAYLGSDGVWKEVALPPFMSTRASKQVIEQHPADGSIWLFCSPDAWSFIGASHLTETGGTLQVDWTDGYFIGGESKSGIYGPDDENPFLAVAPDPATGTIALAYQSADRKYFGTEMLAGSRVAVARIPAIGNPAFIAAQVWAERVNHIGLIVSPGETLLSYRPINETTTPVTHDDLYTIRHKNGVWEEPVKLATAPNSFLVGYGTTRPEFALQTADNNRIHFYTFIPPSNPVPTSTPIPTQTAPTNTPTPSPVPPTPTSLIDTIKPSVTIVSPTNGSTLAKGKILTITSNASDNVGVSKVEFYINNSLKCTDTTSFYTCSWKVPSKPNVVYTLKAVAYDSANNSTPVAINVTAK